MNISSIGAAGMQRASDRFEASANRIARTGTGLETSDLATDIVDMKQAEIDFKASTKVVKVADDMIGAMLDILA
ncbi:hypothetical protein SAMN05428969_2187 [Devosia sp. YR412]|uniref:hypothetical protein n=1 Tax=Devosia sp. YR412 TaxID=1881030 RepID=UPI0008AD623B|nr:hypothetical protein [Devosia sp. YR412]SEQ14716.1 hypothetical protein SAMN05428969_2187 [Devosia sp. YR412]